MLIRCISGACDWSGKDNEAYHLSADELDILKSRVYKNAIVTKRLKVVREYNTFINRGAILCPTCYSATILLDLNQHTDNLIRTYHEKH